MSKFTVFTDKHNEFRWKFVAGNGSVIAKSSEGFKVKEDCVASLTLLQKDVVGASVEHDVRAAAPKVSPASAAVVSVEQKAAAPAPAVAASPAVAAAPAPVAHN